MNNNCRIQYAKDVAIDGTILDIITIDGINKNKDWFEISLAFSSDERESERYAPYIKLAELVK